ncbi:MAG: methylated-DNA--[protein]-cysteine S-methyltransferase [Natronomonas sp.]
MDSQPDAGIYTRESPYLDRYVQIGAASGRILSVSFPEVAETDAETEHPLLDRIQAYLEGSKEEFDDVEVAMTMQTDHRDVLESLRSVPYGEGVTVDTLVRMTSGLDHETEADHQLVRTALSENPTPLVIPDHRVSDGPSAAPPVVEQRLRSLEGI